MELNTENCCFICLRLMDTFSKTKSSSSVNTNPYHDKGKTSLKNICKLLKIDIDIDSRRKNHHHQLETDLKVSLCGHCRQVSRKLSKLFMKLEAVYLETDYYVGELHQRLSNSYKDAELVQNYSRRMTSSPDTLKQLLTVDNVRKLFDDKCSSQRFSPFSLKLELLRCPEETEAKSIHSDTPILTEIVKTEGEDVTEQETEADYEMNFPITGSVLTKDDDPLYEIKFPNLKLEKLDTEETNSIAQRSLPMQRSPKAKPSVKSNVKLTTNKHKCPTCNKILSSKQNLQRHNQLVHLKKRIKCKMCEMLISPCSFRRHREKCDPIKHQKRLEKQQEYKFKCTTCNKYFSFKESLTRHTNTVHLNIKKFSCNLCNKRYKQATHLIDHKERIHLGIKYICQFCNKHCWSKWDLSSHKRNCTQHLKTK